MKHFSTFYSSLLAMFLCLLGAGLSARAQQAEATQQATQLARQTSAQWAGTDLPAANFRISNARIEPTGLLYAYPQQLQAGIPVYNRIVTLVFKAGELRHHAGAFLPVKAFAGQPATPTVTAAAAVAKALASTPAHSTERPVATSAATGPEQQQSFAPAGVAHRPIEVRLVWATDKGTPRLAWNVNVELLATPDWLNIRVDAATGQVLGQDNWTVQEKTAHPAATHGRQLVASANPARTPQALRHPSGAKSTLAVTPASYRVVPFPGERPDITTPRLDTNPWLRAGAGNPVTTYGWHFDGTTDYTYTRGNNVWAYKDTLNTNTATLAYSTPSSGTGGSLVFNDVPDFTQTPTTLRNRRAAVTNLFYWNNLMHDVMYQYGFTEATGNFQADNISRGGTGGDYVRAEAQDGGGTNNANFATPPDGTSGRMQMYLFTGITPTYYINVTAPATVAGNYVAVEGGFSTANKLATLGPISGQTALYADAGSNPVTYLACGTYGGTTPLTGKIAVLYRGTCNYSVKVKNAQLAGAIAAIVINNVAGAPVVMGGTDNTVTIPAVMISQADGATLMAQVANGSVQVTLPKPPVTGPQLDGDYDSGVMSHEYGHGISNRLTGGGINTSCLGNAEQAGEGWSDFFALMMTTDWANTPLTDGSRARPTGTYVNGQSTTGSGIRRYPYSTSLSVNPLTYASMAASTEVHNIGEIWCATVWDMTWTIIQQQGTIEPNLYTSASTGGNAVALNLVMQGLKLQPCEPGFLDSRDAILAADSLLYNGQYHCAIWSAFARRGMGYSAKEGSSNSATDQTAAYDVPGVRLSRNSVPLVGNQFAINITATCECQTQAPVTVTDQLPTGLQYVSSTGGTLSGNTVTFSNLSFAQGQKRTLQIVAQAAAGAACTVALPVNDDRDGNAVGGLTPAVVTSGGNAWAPTTDRAHSGTTAWNASDPNATSDVTLTSAAFTPSAFSVLSFYHFFNTEARYDGGLVAISVNNGTWQDASALFLQNGYNSVFATGTTSVGKPCFSGKSSGLTGAAAFQLSLVDLSSFSGQSIRVRFQFQSDSNNPYANTLPGWYVDDIQVQSGCGGVQQVQLLNSAGTVTGSYAQATFLANPLTTWTGTVSTDWFTAGNWTGGVPTSTVDALIPAGAPRYPLLSAGTPTSAALTLNAGATTTQTGGMLDVQGNWTSNGTFTATGGTVQLGSTAAASILGSSNTRFWNLTVGASTAQSSTAASTAVQRLLTLNGNFVPNGNPFILESNATNTALVVNNGSSVVTGNLTVQRYISPDLNPGLGYRQFSAPISTATVASLATGSFTPVVNPAYNTSAQPSTVTPFPTVYGYDQSRLATASNNLSAFDKGWFSPAATSDALTAGQGYTMSLAAGQTMSVTGSQNNAATQPISLSLTRNSGSTAADAGWALLGNPFPSPYDYSLQAAGDRANLDAAIYIFESTGPYVGSYRAYTNGVGSGDPILAMGQAFFARVSAGQTTGTLNFRNANRVTSYANPTYHRTAEIRPLVQLTLAGTASSLTDDAYIYFEQGATDTFDSQYDAVKLPNTTGLNLAASLSATEQLSIDGHGVLGTTQKVVLLAVGVPAAGSYTFTATQLLNLSTVPVYLRDLQSGALIDLRQQPTYQFTVANAAVLNTTRFELVFSPQQALATVPAALAQQVGVYPNPARTQVTIELPLSLSRQSVTATLVDAMGRTVRQQVLPASLATHQLLLQEVATGVYSLHLTTELGTVVKKLVIE